MFFSILNVKRFSRQLAMLLEADILLTDSLELIALQQRSERHNVLILRIRQRLRNGDTFSDALSCSRIFSGRYRATIKWAERTGSAANIIVALRLLGDDTSARPAPQPETHFERPNRYEAAMR